MVQMVELKATAYGVYRDTAEMHGRLLKYTK